VKTALPGLKKSEKPDLVIANGNGVTGSYGLGKQHAGYLRKLGIDVITGGDCVFYKKDLVQGIDTLPYVLRPANYPAESPGHGWRMANLGGVKVAVVSLLGMAGFSRVHGDNPFTALAPLAERLRRETPYVVVDFHSAATAEKQAFFYHADGKVSAVIGSHGRVPTSDEGILPGGCGMITDAGRTGSQDSVGGTDPATRIQEYIYRVPDWSRDCWERPALQGVILELEASGKTASIRRIRVECENPPEAELRKGEANAGES
jgi:metallophosphoesterase (TIGR00282 family)